MDLCNKYFPEVSVRGKRELQQKKETELQQNKETGVQPFLRVKGHDI